MCSSDLFPSHDIFFISYRYALYDVDSHCSTHMLTLYMFALAPCSGALNCALDLAVNPCTYEVFHHSHSQTNPLFVICVHCHFIVYVPQSLYLFSHVDSVESCLFVESCRFIVKSLYVS